MNDFHSFTECLIKNNSLEFRLTLNNSPDDFLKYINSLVQMKELEK